MPDIPLPEQIEIMRALERRLKEVGPNGRALISGRHLPDVRAVLATLENLQNHMDAAALL